MAQSSREFEVMRCQIGQLGDAGRCDATVALAEKGLGPDFHRLDRTSLRLAHSLKHLVSSCQQSIWNGKAKCLGGFEIDDKLELGRLLDRQRLGLYPFGDLVKVVG